MRSTSKGHSGLSFTMLFRMISCETVRRVVSTVVESAPNLPAPLRKELASVLGLTRWPGFRNLGMAPPSVRKAALERLASRRSQVARILAAAWVSSSEELRRAARAVLAESEQPLYRPTVYPPVPLGVITKEELSGLAQRLVPEESTANREMALLMVAALTAQVPVDGEWAAEGSPDENEAEEVAPPGGGPDDAIPVEHPADMGEKSPLSIAGVTESLQRLVRECPAEILPVGDLEATVEVLQGEIQRAKRSISRAAKLGASLAALYEVHGESLRFFRGDTLAWRAQSFENAIEADVLSAVAALVDSLGRFEATQSAPDPGSAIEWRVRRDEEAACFDAVSLAITRVEELASPRETDSSGGEDGEAAEKPAEKEPPASEVPSRVPADGDARSIEVPDVPIRQTVSSRQEEQQRAINSPEGRVRDAAAPSMEALGSVPEDAIPFASTDLSPVEFEAELLELDERWSKVGAFIEEGSLALAFTATALLEEEVHSPEPLHPGKGMLEATILGRYVRNAASPALSRIDMALDEVRSSPSPGGRTYEPLSSARDLAVLAVSWRPALLTPTPSLVEVVRGTRSIDIPSAHKLRNALLDFLDAGLVLTPGLLQGFLRSDDRRKALDVVTDEIKQWLISKRQKKLKYHPPTTDVWRHWIAPDGNIGRALEAARGAESKATLLVRQLLEQWGRKKVIDRAIDETDRDIRDRKALLKPIEAGARTELHLQAGEAMELLQRWLDASEAATDTTPAFIDRRVEILRSTVRHSLPEIQVAMAERLNAEGQAAPIRSWYRLAQAALPAGTALLEGEFGPEVGNEDLDTPIHRDLLRLQGIPVGLDWSLRPEDRAVALEALLALPPAAGPEDWVRIAADQAAVGNLASARRIAELPDLRTSPALANQVRALTVNFARVLGGEYEKRRSTLESRLDRLAVGGGVEASTLEGLRAGLFTIDGVETPDFLLLNRDLDSIESGLRQFEREHSEELLTRLRKRASGLSDSRRERAFEAFSKGDHALVEALLDSEGIEDALVATSDSSPFQAFWPGTASSILNALDEIPTDQRAARTKREAAHGGSLGSLDFSRLTPSSRPAAQDLIQSWYALRVAKTERELFETSLCALLSGVGFKRVTVESLSSGLRERRTWWTRFSCDPIRLSNRCPCPLFGSEAVGAYRLLLVREEMGPAELMEAIAARRSSTALVVLYMGSVGEADRREIARLARENRTPLALLDEVLMLYLAAQSGQRIETFFWCSIPIGWADPYSTNIGLVAREMFFGRGAEMGELIEQPGASLLYGGRQLGKTALLRQVERCTHDPSAGILVRWIDLKVALSGGRWNDIWQILSEKLKGPGGGGGDTLPFSAVARSPEAFSSKVEAWLERAPRRRILLLLDEADQFLHQDGASKGTFPAVSQLVGLMKRTEARFKVVFAGLHDVQRLYRKVNSPLDQLGRPICIGPLLGPSEGQAALGLVNRPLQMAGLEFDPGAPDLPLLILSCGSYYPSLIQIICKRLLEHMRVRVDRQREGPPYRVCAEDVSAVLTDPRLSDELGLRFSLTMDLDDRYRLIGTLFAGYANGSDHARILMNGVSAEALLRDAESFWSAGFPPKTEIESFRALLDEMIGLGLLRRVSGGAYAPRNESVLRVFSRDWSTQLSRYESLQPATAPDPESERRRSRTEPTPSYLRSPFSASQERLAIHSDAPALVFFGVDAAGIRDADRFLTELLEDRVLIERRDGVKDRAHLLALLAQDDGGDTEKPVTYVVSDASSYEPQWVVDIAEQVAKLSRRRWKNRPRSVILAPPEFAWKWCEPGSRCREDFLGMGGIEVTMKPWSVDVARDWLQDEVQLGFDATELWAAFGGWPALYYRFLERVKLSETKREVLRLLLTDWLSSVEGLRDFGLDECGRLLLMRCLLESQPKDQSEGRTPLTSDTGKERILLWARLLGLVECAGGAAPIAMDSVVRRLVEARETP